MSLLAEYWRRFACSEHPDDKPVFDSSPQHTFNLQFPPPAFVGRLDAPIVILMSNGGYKPGITEAEFPSREVIEGFAACLRGENSSLPPHLSSYYFRGRLGALIKDGKAVLVNAIPYRSPRLSKEPNNQAVARRLRSLEVHRTWLFREVLPAARNKDRFVFVHRNGWWSVPRSEASDFVIFSDPQLAEPNRPAPDGNKLAHAEAWLATRH